MQSTTLLKKKKTTSTTTPTTTTATATTTPQARTTSATTTNTNTSTTDTTTTTPTFSEEYEKYKQNLTAQKVNANNEIAIAEQNTQKYINNYLKNQGLYGSGMGGSIQAGVYNQANQLRNENTQNFNTQLNEYTQDYNTNKQQQAIDNIQAMVDSGSTKEQIEAYLDKYKNDAAITSGTLDQINDYLNNQSGAVSWTVSRDQDVEDIANAISSASNNKQKYELQQLANELKNATTQEEYDAAVKKYEDYINLANNGGYTSEEVLSGNYGVQTNSITSNADFYNKLGIPKMNDMNKSGSGQDKHITKLLEKAKNGSLENNTLYDVNKGLGDNYYVLYKDGIFYYVGGEDKITGEYANLKKVGSSQLK